MRFWEGGHAVAMAYWNFPWTRRFESDHVLTSWRRSNDGPCLRLGEPRECRTYQLRLSLPGFADAQPPPTHRGLTPFDSLEPADAFLPAAALHFPNQMKMSLPSLCMYKASSMLSYGEVPCGGRLKLRPNWSRGRSARFGRPCRLLCCYGALVFPIS